MTVGNTEMKYSGRFVTGLLTLVLITACAEQPAASDSGSDMYVVSDGLLVIDTKLAAHDGVRVLDHMGQPLDGVIVLRAGLSIAVDNGAEVVIEASPDALAVLDTNSDQRLDATDPAWHNMHLAVDYNGDGIIGEGEYALIGECGVDALELDLEAGQAWSHHSDGARKPVQLPGAA
jgi:hypothetical protein